MASAGPWCASCRRVILPIASRPCRPDINRLVIETAPTDDHGCGAIGSGAPGRLARARTALCGRVAWLPGHIDRIDEYLCLAWRCL